MSVNLLNTEQAKQQTTINASLRGLIKNKGSLECIKSQVSSSSGCGAEDFFSFAVECENYEVACWFFEQFRDQCNKVLPGVVFSLFDQIKEEHAEISFNQEQKDFLKFLSENGAKFSFVRAGNHLTPLNYLIQSGTKDAFSFLLALDPTLATFQAEKSLLPLFFIVKSGADELLELLIADGADLHVLDANQNNLLHHAAFSGNTSIAKILSNYPVFQTLLNAQNGNNCSPLTCSCMSGNNEISLFLLEQGADVRCVDSFRMSPFHRAIPKSSSAVILKMLDLVPELVNARVKYGSSPFQLALNSKRIDLAGLFIDRGAHIVNIDKGRSTTLNLAVKTRSQALVKLILQKSPESLHSINSNGDTALHTASIYGDDNMSRFLIGQGADICARNAKGQTPLHFAVKFSGVETVKALLKQNPFVILSRDFNGETLLHWASRGGDLDTVKELLEMKIPLKALPGKGGDSELLKQNVNLMTPSFSGELPIHAAAESGHLDIIKHFLSLQPSLISARGSSKNTPLHFACHGSDHRTVEFLLSKGALLDAKNEAGATPFLCAVASGDTELVNIMLSNSPGLIADRNNNGDTALHIAAAQNSVEMGTILASHGAHLNERNNSGETPFILAVKNVSFDVIDSLIVKDSSFLKDTDNLGNTPLHFASDFTVVQWLIKAGADPLVKNADGNTPLHLAALNEDGDAVFIPLLRNAPELLEMKNNKGETALTLAIQSKNIISIESLINEGANLTKVSNINVQDDNGNTLLHLASRAGAQHTVEYLCLLNADLSLQNDEGQTALHLASKMGHYNITLDLLNLNPLIIDVEDNNDDTALMMAVRGKHEFIIELLIDMGANINRLNTIESASKALMALGGDADVFIKIIEHTPALITEANEEGHTLLHYAAIHGFYQAVELFCRKGSILKARDKEGKTAFDLAIENGNADYIDTLKIFLKYDPTLLFNMSIETASTSLQSFLTHEKEALFAKCTPLHLFPTTFEDAKLFFVHGPSGHTPLHFAALMGHDAPFLFLLENHKDLFFQDNFGIFLTNDAKQSPYICLLANGRKECLSAIAAHTKLGSVYQEPQELLSSLKLLVRLLREYNSVHSFDAFKLELLKNMDEYKTALQAPAFFSAIQELVSKLKEPTQNLRENQEVSRSLSLAATDIPQGEEFNPLRDALLECQSITESLGSKIEREKLVDISGRRAQFEDEDIFAILETTTPMTHSPHMRTLKLNLEFLECEDKDLYAQNVTCGADLKEHNIDNDLRHYCDLIEEKTLDLVWIPLLQTLEAKLQVLHSQEIFDLDQEIKVLRLHLESFPRISVIRPETKTMLLRRLRQLNDKILLHTLKKILKS